MPLPTNEPMFYKYKSKPIERLACQILETDELKEGTGGTWYLKRYFFKPVAFKSYEKPVVGDWVVFLNKEDTYHCTDAVFRERNTVESV